MSKNLLSILDNVSQDTNPTPPNDRYLIIDGLNLFFRNFAMLNMVNSKGTHIGGLGGFLRSLGALIRQINPTEVYGVFDGPGSSMARKNINPKYKANRNITRITNWEVFDDFIVDEENKIVSTPAYMLAGNISEAASGIEKLVHRILKWV